MNKKTVLKAAGLFVAGVVGGIGLMMSNDAYKAVNDALGNSTSNSLWKDNSLAQNALNAAQQQQAQVQKLVQDAGTLKSQADQFAPLQQTQGDSKKQNGDASEKQTQAQAQEEQQRIIQEQIQQMIQQIQQMLQQMQQSQNDMTKALVRP
ncbi:hypothetical protein [Cohnella rhizosphaerae]|uniref:Uncharacterized protein n=1 Tax=Cohnella rhizosphaerae TaxID=1457232 RepID=A0A9X4KU20_9BACL|nr:hypothetical protein [Cohnella rhizosphaerae]MDG0811101.1 hypothetical protein [Cohnella rhizosphaerae]